MTNDLAHRMPWEAAPPAPEKTVDEKIMALQSDFMYAWQNTSIVVHSNREDFQIIVNTTRGQIVPSGRAKFKDGTYVEFTDFGMPQPNARLISVPDLVAWVFNKARELGLEPAL